MLLRPENGRSPFVADCQLVVFNTHSENKESGCQN
jgi:hypothetical protein